MRKTGSGRPFTLVVCTGCEDGEGGGDEGGDGQGGDGRVLDVLRQAVRGCPHGVLISVGCLGRFLHCRPGRGLYAAVQPCAADRRPDGTVVRLGPITDGADAEAVGAWLRAGLPDDGTLLPGHLRAAPAPRHVAHLN
ncbi:hypothetical protein [Streptomyces sp. NPDC002845]